MKKEELLKAIDSDLLDKLYGFCYSRTDNSHEAQELCSDILFALVKAANSDGEIDELYPFVWRIARNVYADFSENRKKTTERTYTGDADELFFLIPYDEEEDSEEIANTLRAIYRRIAFLSSAYREVMISYYLDGLSTKEIAKRQGTSEVAIRQRLFSARRKIQNEVDNMTETYNKPVGLDKIQYILCGTGNPSWDDPASTCERLLSRHIVWLCRNKAMSATEIASELNIPTIYVEEELELLAYGEKGNYGLLRKLDNGKYIINFILFDTEVFKAVNQLYIDELPRICDVISKFIEEHEEEYLSFPYINKNVDLNLVIWQQVHTMACTFSKCVDKFLATDHFASLSEPNRPFSTFGYVFNGKRYGVGRDGIKAANLCGYSSVHLSNIYISRIQPHFRWGHNISHDYKIMLAVRAIEGINVNTLSEREKEEAAKAIEEGYLYREGDNLYTKILVSNVVSDDELFATTNKLKDGYFDKEAKILAKKLAEIFKKAIPEHLLNEWRYANMLATMPVLDNLVEALIERGILTPPENGLGAEGCWMSVKK